MFVKGFQHPFLVKFNNIPTWRANKKIINLFCISGLFYYYFGV